MLQGQQLAAAKGQNSWSTHLPQSHLVLGSMHVAARAPTMPGSPAGDCLSSDPIVMLCASWAYTHLLDIVMVKTVWLVYMC